MILHPRSIKNKALILLLFLVSFYLCQKAEASSLSGAVSGLKVDQISSFNQMKTALTLLQSCSQEAKQKNLFTFSLQKLILSKSGECISKIVEIEQQADNQIKREEARALFLTNRNIIKSILTWNQKKVEDLQENKLDQIEDTTAFFNSPEWQQPQYLISLASYWLSWNGYYSSLFYSANDAFRKDLLDEAVDGFSRSLIDFEEESIMARSLFGRALSYKEMHKYDKAIYDINSVLGKIKRDNPLYVRSRYEKVLISYLTGNYESALSQLKIFRGEVGEKNIPRMMEAGLKKLQVKIILALLEKDKDKKGGSAKKNYRDALQELKKLVASDERQAGELYRFVKEHVKMFGDLSYTELGAIGNLAIADWYFDQKQYDKAFARYKYLYTSSDTLIKKRMDDVYFRSGYCLCQKEQWQDALSSFESLFNKFPHSSFTGKAACLYYVAATNHYKENPEKSAYTRYIETIQIYLKRCNDPKDKSEAHFQLGKYYQDKEKTKKALKEFSLVGKDSPNYLEARYSIVTSNVDKLESLNKRGLRRSGSAKRIYQDTKKQFGEYQKLMLNQEEGRDTKELKAHMAVLQAKLYAYSPDGTCKKALQKLKGFESRFPRNKKLHLMAKSLRMECYQRLQMVKEAKEEINSFLKEDVADSDRWTFLNECANKFYDESKSSRNKGNNHLASQQAEMALMVYGKLSSIALKNKSYKRFYASIQLRMAEIYRDENQIAEAKVIYKEMLKRDPLSADAMYNLGLIYEKEGNWEEAIATWRKFSKGLKTGSYYWFESRYRTAKVLNQLDRRDESCEITTMIHVLHPELRDESFKKKFMELQKEVCGKEER
jgi:tetratricopeptide (TPR) repeat protein